MNMNKYIDIWKACLPFILQVIYCGKQDNLDLPAKLFWAVGDRAKSGYDFNLEYKEGKQVLSTSGSAVARDMEKILMASSEFISWIREKNVRFEFKEFKLTIFPR